MASENLTDKRVLSVRAEPGQRLELFDKGARGLVLRVTGEGHKTWVVRYRTPDGRQPRLKLGDYPAVSLKEARAKAAAKRLEISNGSDPAAEKRRERHAARAEPIKTVDDLATAYFAACRSGEYRARSRAKAESTLIGEEGVYRRHLKNRLGHERVEDVTTDSAKRQLRLVGKAAAIQANRAHSLLSQLYSYAVSEGRVPSSPMVQLRKPSAENVRTRVLSDEEVQGIWSALQSPGGLTFVEGAQTRRVCLSRPVAIALELTMLTLQRRSEVAEMRRDELALDRGEWVIAAGRTKNRRAHLVPLAPRSVELVREAIRLADDGLDADAQRSLFVFVSPRAYEKAIGGGALTHALRDVLDALKIPDARLHDLRRTGATALTSERGGQRRFVVSKLLNHSDNEGAAVTGVYDRNEYAVEKRRALLTWERLLQEQVGVAQQPANVVQLTGTAA